MSEPGVVPIMCIRCGVTSEGRDVGAFARAHAECPTKDEADQ